MRLSTASTATIPNSISISNGISISHNNGGGVGGGGGGVSVNNSSSANIAGHVPEWFMLPQAVDVNNDVMCLVSSLSTVVQILTRMTNAAAQELRQHPEREEGFQGLRLLLTYADQMYTTLLQVEILESNLIDIYIYVLCSPSPCRRSGPPRPIGMSAPSRIIYSIISSSPCWWVPIRRGRRTCRCGNRKQWIDHVPIRIALWPLRPVRQVLQVSVHLGRKRTDQVHLHRQSTQICIRFEIDMATATLQQCGLNCL